ncbi:hypothetical protein LPJ61_006085 [Coemansia biformis]|uniref:Uncharacterized protein n=1 Tax=Coemansia biformis TaxID=1286918 RepID=A0A9W8CPA1_9FUNG|nr:hypothetical protein LPJ61_006085 [Coemansia biformis]
MPVLPDPYQLRAKQVDVVRMTLPVIALSYLKAAAGTFRQAKSGIARAGQGIVFAIANVPIVFGPIMRPPSPPALVATEAAAARGRDSPHGLELGATPEDAKPGSIGGSSNSIPSMSSYLSSIELLHSALVSG